MRVYHYIDIISFKCLYIYIIHKSLNEFGKGRAFTDVLDSLKTFFRSSCFFMAGLCARVRGCSHWWSLRASTGFDQGAKYQKMSAKNPKPPTYLTF